MGCQPIGQQCRQYIGINIYHVMVYQINKFDIYSILTTVWPQQKGGHDVFN